MLCQSTGKGIVSIISFSVYLNFSTEMLIFFCELILYIDTLLNVFYCIILVAHINYSLYLAFPDQTAYLLSGDYTFGNLFCSLLPGFFFLGHQPAPASLHGVLLLVMNAQPSLGSFLATLLT